MDSNEKGLLITLFFVTNCCLIEARLLDGIFKNNHGFPKWYHKNVHDLPLSNKYRTPYHHNYKVPSPPIIKSYPNDNVQNRELSWIMNYYPLMKNRHQDNNNDDYYSEDGPPEMTWHNQINNDDYPNLGKDNHDLNDGILLNSNYKIPRNTSQVIHHFVLEIPHKVFQDDNKMSKNHNMTDDDFCMAKILYPIFEGRRGDNMIIGYMDHRIIMNPGMINTELNQNMYNSSLFYQNYANLYHNFTHAMILNHKKLPLFVTIAHKQIFIGYLHHLILNATMYAMLNRNMYFEHILKQYPNMDKNLIERLRGEMHQTKLTSMHHVLMNLPYHGNYKELQRSKYPLQVYQGYQSNINGINWNGYPIHNTRVAFYLHHPFFVPKWYNGNEYGQYNDERNFIRYLSGISDEISNRNRLLINQPQQHNGVAYNYWLQSNGMPSNQYFTKLILHYYIPLSRRLHNSQLHNKFWEILRNRIDWHRYNNENNEGLFTPEIDQKEPWELITEENTETSEREYEKYIKNEYSTSSKPNIEKLIEKLKETEDLKTSTVPSNLEKLIETLEKTEDLKTSTEPSDLEKLIETLEKTKDLKTSTEPSNLVELIQELKEKQEKESNPTSNNNEIIHSGSSGHQQDYYLHQRNHSYPAGQYDVNMWNSSYMNDKYSHGSIPNGNWMNVNMSYYYHHQNRTGQNLSPQEQYYWYRYYSQHPNQNGEHIPRYNRTYYTMNQSMPYYQWHQYQNQYPQGYNMSYYYMLNGSVPQSQWYQYYHQQQLHGYNRTYHYNINGSMPQYQYQWYQHYYIPGMRYYPYQNGSRVSYVDYPSDQKSMFEYQNFQYNNNLPENQYGSHLWNRSYYYTSNGTRIPYYSNGQYWNGNQYITYNKTYYYTYNVSVPMVGYNHTGPEAWLHSEYFPYENGSMVSFRDNSENRGYNYYYRYHSYSPSQSQVNGWHATYYYTMNGTAPQYQYYYNMSQPEGNVNYFYPYQNGSMVSFRDRPVGHASTYRYMYNYNATIPGGSQYSRWHTSYTFGTNGTAPQQYQYNYNITQPGYGVSYYYPYVNGTIVSFRDYPKGSMYYYQYNSSYPNGMQYHNTWNTSYYIVNGVKYYYNITQPSGSYQYQYPNQNKSHGYQDGSGYSYYYHYRNSTPQYQYGKWNATYSLGINGTDPSGNGQTVDFFFPFQNGSMVSYNDIPRGSSSYYYYYQKNSTVPYSGNQRLGYESNYPQGQGSWSYYHYRNGSTNNVNSGNQGYGNHGYYSMNRTYMYTHQSQLPSKSWNYTMTYQYPNQGSSATYNRSWTTNSLGNDGKYVSGEYNRFNLSLIRKYDDKSWQYQNPAENSGMWHANLTYTYKYPNGTVITQHHTGYNSNMNMSAWNSSAQLNHFSSQSLEYPTVSHSRAWNISVNYGYYPNGTRYYTNGGNNGGTHTQNTYSHGGSGVVYSYSTHKGGNSVTDYSTLNGGGSGAAGYSTLNGGGNGAAGYSTLNGGGSGAAGFSTLNGGINGTSFSYSTHNNGGNGGSYSYSSSKTGGNGGSYSYTTHQKNGKTVTYYSQSSVPGGSSSQHQSGGYYSGGSYSGGGSTTQYTQGANGKYTVHSTSVESSQPASGSYSYQRSYYRSSSSRAKRDESAVRAEDESIQKVDNSTNITAPNTSSNVVNTTRVSNVTKDHPANNSTSIKPDKSQNGTTKNLQSPLSNSTTISENVTVVGGTHGLKEVPLNLTSFNVTKNRLNDVSMSKSIFNTTKSVFFLNGLTTNAKGFNSDDVTRPQPLKFTLSLSVALDTPDVTDANPKNKT